MKSLFFAVSLAAALMTTSALAQLGPAGVPGAPGLAETDPSVKAARPLPPPPPLPVANATPTKRSATGCGKNDTQCKARQETRKKMLEACRGTTGKERKQCLSVHARRIECSKTADPQQCELHSLARERCKDTNGREHSQCLRDALTPRD